ncbi:MAG TPA: helix-turn-helix transcriptional regulator [Blastocatellia bacterium]|nr:helix-turn-helix transcriptional regulator [Blastocatellia bacterium]
MNKPKNPQSEIDSLSAFVRRIMRQKRLSIRDIQTRAGGPDKIAASYISRIINAKVTNLSVDKLTVLAEGLDVDPFELFAAASGRQIRTERDGVDALELIETMEQAVGNPASLEVVRRWLRLGPEYQSAVLNWIRFLSDEARSNKKPSKRPPKKP